MLVAFWQPFYLLVSLLYVLLSYITPRQFNKSKDLNSAYEHLRQLYRYAGISSFLVHVSFVLYITYHNAFFSTYFRNILVKNDEVYNTHTFMLMDYVLGSTGVMLWMWYVVTEEQLSSKARWLMLLIGGPGACFAVGMRQREKTIYQEEARRKGMRIFGLRES